MEGLEGRIVKIDRRKQRARIRLDLYDNSHLIDLGFEELEARDEEPSPPSPPSADDKRSPQQVSGGDRAWTAELAAKAGSDAGKHGTK